MNFKKRIGIISVLLIVSMLFTSCKVLFPTQSMLDDVLPHRDTHFYCKADLIPYNKAELKNAKTMYGLELSEYFYANKDREFPDEKEKEDFTRILSYRNHNYVLVRERYEQYNDDMVLDVADYNQADQEFNDYYRLDDSPIAPLVKQQNDGYLMGNPNISFRLILSTVQNKNIYYEGEAEIYIPVTIHNATYEKMVIGDDIQLDLPVSSGDKNNKETYKTILTYVATDSFAYKNSKGEDDVLFVSPKDGIGNYRKLVDRDGNMCETYLENRPLRILKYSRIGEGIDAERLVTSIMQGGGMSDFIIDDIVDKVASGGYLNETYKDYIYANAVYTNMKGYVTTAINYTALYIDNEYARQYIQNNPKDLSALEGSIQSSIPDFEEEPQGIPPEVLEAYQNQNFPQLD